MYFFVRLFLLYTKFNGEQFLKAFAEDRMTSKAIEMAKTVPIALLRKSSKCRVFKLFNGRVLIFTEAGLAANHCSSLVKGLIPLRFGLAGTLTVLIFNKPGRVKLPTPFLCSEA